MFVPEVDFEIKFFGFRIYVILFLFPYQITSSEMKID